MRYRICNTEQLLALNQVAMELGYNRQLDPKGIAASVDPQGKHLLYPLMVHEKPKTAPHIRARVLIKVRGSYDPVPVQLDIPIETFDALDEAPEKEVLG